MLGVDPVEKLGGVQHLAVLGIVERELAVQVAVPAAFVSVIPKQNAGMVHITGHHFPHQQAAHGSIVSVLPAAKLVENIKAELVAGFEKCHVGRIVGHPHGVHIHGFDEADIVVIILDVERTAGFGTETVPRHSLQENALPIEEDSLPLADFKRAEAKTLIDGVQDGRPQAQSEA